MRASGVVELAGEADRAFGLASVTKLLSAYALHVALEEASISLDEACGPPGASVAHLLSHASGLSADDATRVLAPPGTRRIYSSAGFEVLARHLEAATGIAFGDYLDEAVLGPLGMARTELVGSPAHGARASLADLAVFAAELLAPRLLAPASLTAARRVAFPGLGGVLPGFGYQARCDWGLGFEVRGDKSPHWTGRANSPATFGHFGQSGTFLWVEPDAGLALVYLSDEAFGPRAKQRWPALSDAVLAACGPAGC